MSSVNSSLNSQASALQTQVFRRRQAQEFVKRGQKKSRRCAREAGPCPASLVCRRIPPVGGLCESSKAYGMSSAGSSPSL